MALINIPAFSGLNILAAPQRIEEHQATVAVGCDFRSLDLRPFKEDQDIGQVTTNTSGIANGATLYQVDTNTWLGLQGDKSVARSPALLSGSAIAQRVFVADNEGPTGTEWDWVRDVPVSAITNATLTGNEKRLGVPRPAAPATPEHIQKNGRVTYLERFTNDSSKIVVSDPSAVKVGDKLYLDVPGIGEASFSVTKKDATDPYALTLGNSKLTYVQCNLIRTANSTAITFKKTSHGFTGGEQVILNHRGDTDASFVSTKLPNNVNGGRGYNQLLLSVVWVSVDEFKLTWDEAGTELALKATAGTAGPIGMKYAVVAQANDAIETPWLVSQVVVNTLANLQQKVTYGGLQSDTDVTSTWQSAVDTLVERAYLMTFVNEYGDESEPSDPTKTILVAQGDPVTFAAIPTTAAPYAQYAAGNDVPTLAKYPSITEVRVYRTDSTGAFRLLTTDVDAARKLTWTEVTTSGFTFVDTYEDTELGEPLATTGWRIPPKDLNGLLVTPGGSLIGHNGRTVYGSVPYAPYAFPLANQVAFDYTVVGMVATSAGIVVVTEGNPALIVGDDPSTWSIQKLEYPYGCVSRRSIVDMGEMAIYASADGLVGVAGANVEILTKDVMTRAQWNALYSPGNIRAAHAEGRYYGATKVGNTYKAFMFDPRTRTFINFTADQTNYTVALYTRLSDDTLLIMRSNGRVYEWNRGTNEVPYLWRSKAFQLTKPDIFGCAQLIAPALVSNKTFTMRLIAWDGETVYTLAAFSNKTDADFDAIAAGVDTQWEGIPRRYAFNKNINPFRLPVPNNRYTVYYVELEGNLPIAQVSLAATMDEIKQV